MADTEVHRSVAHAPAACHAEFLPRISAAFSGACLLFHIVLVFLGGPAMLSMSLPMLGLAGLCAGCAVNAWRRRCSDRELGLMALFAGVMVSAHLILTSGTSGMAICSSTVDTPAWTWVSGGASDMPALAEQLMPAGVVLAAITGLIAAGALAQRRFAPGDSRMLGGG